MPTRQQIHSAGWWSGYDAGRVDEQEGVDRSARIAPKIPVELDAGYTLGNRLGEILGAGVVVAAAVVASLVVVAVVVGLFVLIGGLL